MSAQAPAIVTVALDVPLRRLYDYLPPLAGATQPGVRVRVPFGRGQRVGVVTGHASRSDWPADQLKRITAVLDDTPLLTPALLELLATAARYYHHAPGEVWLGALPAALRRGDAACARHTALQLTPAAQGTDVTSLRAPAQRALLELLRGAGGALPLDAIKAVQPRYAAAARALAARGLVHPGSAPAASPTGNEAAHALNAEQQAAVSAIGAAFGTHACFVLDGITGSGKTEVYLQLMQHLATRQRQTLMLVPEISLTPQTVARLQARLGSSVAVLHSGLSDSARLAAWLAARDGRASVVLGTRSALWTPLARPGLIVVDEEHDPSYKQQDGLRYSARDLAVLRGQIERVPVVLGSATPALETLAQAQRGRYRTLTLRTRAGGAGTPSLELVDLRRASMHGPVAAPLAEAVRSTLDEGGQALLFLNRRGFAPVLLCHACGAAPTCKRCDSRLTWHRARHRMLCHHCGHERPEPAVCEGCGAGDLHPLGAGTERIENILAEQFPDVPLVRLDRDTATTPGALAQRLDAMRSGSARLLVGTQMLAKGHHFPEVALAAVLDADQGLYATDFRAPERLAQLLWQVAGRCGRGTRPGRVLVQTHHPHHPLFAQLQAGSYRALADTLLSERAVAGLPPYAHMALLRAQAPAAEAPLRFLEQARACFPADCGVEVLGPVPAPQPRRAGLHRAQLLLQATRRSALHRALTGALPRITALPSARRVRWSLDVDPADTY